MQLKYHMVTIEDLVPENHFLRRLEAALDSSCVHEETAHLYSQRYGRPPIDPVVMVKYLLLVFLYGIPSERQIEVRQCEEAVRPYPPPFPYPGKGGGSAGCIPRRRATYSTAGTACQGAMGDTSSRAAVDEAGKMGWSLLVTVSRRYTKTPLRFLSEAMFCVRLTVH